MALKSIDGLVTASLKSINWLAKASVKTIDNEIVNLPTYATRNPSDKSANISLSWGDLVATSTTSGSRHSARATQGKSSGKWYWEYVVTKSGWGAWNAMVWVAEITASLSTYVGVQTNSVGYYSYNGKSDSANAFRNSANITYWTAYTLWDVIGVAVNMDAWEVTFYKNNVSQGTLTWFSWTLYPMVSPRDTNLAVTANFGATALTYSPPVWFNSGLYT